MRRKGKKLTSEDHEVWTKVVESIEPLRKLAPAQTIPLQASTPLIKTQPRPTVKPLTRIGGGLSGGRTTVNLATDPMKEAEKHGKLMDRRNFDRLRKGKLRPDAKIDLHGMTVAQAHGSLTDFVFRSHASGKRLLLVVTGKGNSTRDEQGIMPTRRGVLRHSLPHWLSAPNIRPMILEITPAHAKHGGGGAYYVYLRRKR